MPLYGYCWLFHFFMKRSSAAVLMARITLKSKSHNRQKEGKFTSYCEAVNSLLERYVRDDVIAKMQA